VITHSIGRDWDSADIAVGQNRKEDVAVFPKMRHRNERQLCRIMMGRVPESGDVSYGKQGMRAVFPTQHARVAESPGAILADLAIPVAVIGVVEAGFTKGAFLGRF
jgi:hypothetical protein